MQIWHHWHNVGSYQYIPRTPFGNARSSRGSEIAHAAPQIQLICFSISLEEIFVPRYQIFLKNNFLQYLVPSPFASTSMPAFPWQQHIKTYHHHRHHQTVDCRSSFSFCIVLGNPETARFLYNFFLEKLTRVQVFKKKKKKHPIFSKV